MISWRILKWTIISSEILRQIFKKHVGQKEFFKLQLKELAKAYKFSTFIDNNYENKLAIAFLFLPEKDNLWSTFLKKKLPCMIESTWARNIF